MAWHHDNLRNCSYCLGNTMFEVDGKGLMSPQPSKEDVVSQCQQHPRILWIEPEAKPAKKVPAAKAVEPEKKAAKKPAAKKAASKKTPAKKASSKKAK